MSIDDTIYVIDSSSIIRIKHHVQGSKNIKKVFDNLTKLAEEEKLVYPPQVLDELGRWTDNGGNKDLPFQWADENSHIATKHKITFEEVKDILSQPEISRILDPDKPPKPEEADPYILALANKLMRNNTVKVITQERSDTPTKLSLNSACGLLGIVSLPIEPFLAQRGIYPG